MHRGRYRATPGPQDPQGGGDGVHGLYLRDFHKGRRVAAFSGFARTASRKLDQLDAATELRDLARPGNCLEGLKGDRRDQWSIRFDDQWRLCF